MADGSSSASPASSPLQTDLLAVPDNVDNVIPRIRILSLHLIGFLFQQECDYMFMMNFLRNFLDWMDRQDIFVEVQSSELPTLDESSEVASLNSVHPSSPLPKSDVIDNLINKCLESDISDFEMARRIDDVDISDAVERNGETFESLKNPLYVWQFMFDPDDYNISEFIAPLRTGNFGSIVKYMISYTISTKIFDARTRTFILAISEVLNIDYEMLKACEVLAVDEVGRVSEYKKKKERMSAASIAAVGLAATGGAAIMGLTGGLAAPFIVSGIATVFGTSSTVFLATAAGLATITAVFGVVGGGLAAYKVNKVVGSIEEFEFVKIKEERSVAFTIVMNGLHTSGDKSKARNILGHSDNQLKAWTTLGYSEEQYLLKYETKQLKNFTTSLVDFVGNVAVTVAADEIIKYTILAALATSLTWPATLLTFYSIIDNPWTVCMKRTKAVGRHLSQVLISRVQGNRPVTLIGYGFGARVIFFCLLNMATKHTPEEYSGIVENAVLCGTPVTSQRRVWTKLCHVVSGKVVNGYSSKDWVLSFLYKTTNVTKGVAGITPVEVGDRKLVNVDLSSIVSGHFDYESKMVDILKIVGMARVE